MLYKVNSNSNHCLFSELPLASREFHIPELWLQLVHWSLKYQGGVECPNFQGVSCWQSFICEITFLTLEHWMGSKGQSTVGRFPKLCFFLFSIVV